MTVFFDEVLVQAPVSKKKARMRFNDDEEQFCSECSQWKPATRHNWLYNRPDICKKCVKNPKSKLRRQVLASKGYDMKQRTMSFKETKRAVKEEKKLKARRVVIGPGKVLYTEYLKTEHWKRKREAALRRAGHRCQVCTATSNLQVHHNSYGNVGKESVYDLFVLCTRDHSHFHEGPCAPKGPDFVHIEKPLSYYAI